MFGYVRPCRPELKCREWDLYRATYCGLCCTLRERYGLLAPMFLSYDMTFLALLLEKPETHTTLCKGRCHANLLLKKQRVQESEALNLCADYSIILTWHKLQDTLQDSGFIKKISSKILCFFLKRTFIKASTLHPEFSSTTETALTDLQELENQQCPSMDQAANCFALILKETVPTNLDATSYRSLQLLLYHVGRWIYLIDARDDFEEDKKQGDYNPLLYFYGATPDDEALSLTLSHSLSLARSGLVFLDLGVRTPMIENILSLGLPLIQDSVLKDTWKKTKSLKHWRKPS